MTAQRFRKKPVEIEAMHFDGTSGSASGIVAWVLAGGGQAHFETVAMADGAVVIETLEGDMRATLGDWVIRGVAGEHYPCKPDIFAATYEPVES
ncbi:hypothetical protein [Nocardia wallacei]|uniref:hypothetical protein n=1 Tax=Nocardia wallacei TaxID=480035 RepID=UPI002456469E|nr:hypothetical protein [Nocardia wallacei]